MPTSGANENTRKNPYDRLLDLIPNRENEQNRWLTPTHCLFIFLFFFVCSIFLTLLLFKVTNPDEQITDNEQAANFSTNKLHGPVWKPSTTSDLQ